MNAGAMFDFAALRFMLTDGVQLLKLVALVSAPAVVVAITALWIVSRRKNAK